MTARALAAPMARQAGDPRVRYIGFKIAQDGVSRNRIIEEIRRTGRALDPKAFEAASPWLTRYDGTHGIVRCTHTGVATTRRILETIRLDEGRIETVGTSGTIRGLVSKHLPELAERDDTRP